MERISDLKEEITLLKKKVNAVILAHNYQTGAIQDVADFVGDSLELSRIASGVSADVIIFCGVYFMAETAAILSPRKKVILPEISAGCPLADMITVEELRSKKQRYPGAKVVCYVNSPAVIKAESDICCTSANAVEVVNSLKEEEVIFIPDRNLAHYVSKHTDKKIIPPNGYCPVHNDISREDVKIIKEKYPNAPLVVHPECPDYVVELADKVASTGGIIRFSKETRAKKIIVGTEEGIIYRLKKENPDKDFLLLSQGMVCKDMKKITLTKVLKALKELKPVVAVNENVRIKALKAIEKMFEI